MKHVLHLLTDVGPRSFGLGTAALHLGYQQSQLGWQVTFWSLSDENDVRWASAVSGVAANHFESFVGFGPGRLAYSPAMERAASHSSEKGFHVVHQHGIWTGISRVATRLRAYSGVPVVIAPHGSLTPWALSRSRLKKRIALALYERENLREASCLHAVAETEVGEIRAFGLTNPVAVIPNAVADTWRHSTGSAERFRERFRLPADRRIMLFLSRITPKKGIPMLLEAMYQARSALADWMLVIAGADEFGHLAQVEALVAQLNLDEMVRFVGPLLDQPKRDAFAAAELFVLPSHSEGAPLVIPEA
ncbi:MAG: glycosyltransferase, partial [Candidatus Methanomethylicaceae archaeon]